MDREAIELCNISHCFRVDSNRTTTLKEYIVNMLRKKLHYKEFWALQDVSLQVKHGEVLGVIGHNGAGKSTLLKIISGILKPTKGTCKTVGTVVPLLELGTGFDMELTGRENIYLNGAILGYSKAFLDSKFDEIVAFSEMREFIDIPLKTYSSGMLARIAFSIATVVKPDILLVDEVLAVGDQEFQQKSYVRMMELMDSGTTVLFVSHNMQDIRNLCQSVVWLEHGRVRQSGTADEVCQVYLQSCL